ncbi:hypothetical protein LCGC14_1917620 [marine sediment metagenome]|uniref:Uncharacterized protein n=1 Tax=marine sediment metagenome TaxID=412755 RepID=A0A0F9I5Q6_9ZZZZ
MSTDSSTAFALMDGWKIEVREPWHGSPKLDDGNVEENQIGFMLVAPSGKHYSSRIKFSSLKDIGPSNPLRQGGRRTLALAMEETLHNILTNEKKEGEDTLASPPCLGT